MRIWRSKMHKILEKILENKRNEVDCLRQLIENDDSHPLRKFITKNNAKKVTGRFQQAVETEGLSVIAEIKRQSPSSGKIGVIQEPEILAKRYVSGDASAISVLTDDYAFGGSHNDLSKVRTSLPTTAILRKDFIIDLIQIAETAYLGADAALLIVAVLGEKTKEYFEICKSFGLDALVEVHNELELRIALDAGANIIGVNNRDLHTFDTDLQVSESLARKIPENILMVSESGMHSPEDAKRMRRYGYDAVLIGEALVRSSDPEAFIAQVRGVTGHD